MATHMKNSNVDMNKVLVLPKGINLDFFQFQEVKDTQFINAIVTRSLLPEYKHDIILKAFSILKQNNLPFKLTIVGNGILLDSLKNLAKTLNIEINMV